MFTNTLGLAVHGDSRFINVKIQLQNVHVYQRVCGMKCKTSKFSNQLLKSISCNQCGLIVRTPRTIPIVYCQLIDNQMVAQMKSGNVLTTSYPSFFLSSKSLEQVWPFQEIIKSFTSKAMALLAVAGGSTQTPRLGSPALASPSQQLWFCISVAKEICHWTHQCLENKAF